MDISEVLGDFRKRKLDCGVISFNSVHPRWSYIRINEADEVVETAEKHPLSNHAIAGFYYFAHGSEFIKAAKQAICKRETYNDRFFISASINEIILMNRKVGFYEIETSAYHSLYSPERIAEYTKESRKL